MPSRSDETDQRLSLSVSPGYNLWVQEDLILECQLYNADLEVSILVNEALKDYIHEYLSELALLRI